MKHQPERGQRILAFLLAGTLAWSQVPVSALAETQDTAQQTETEEAAAAASTETEGTSAASDMSTGTSSAASEKSASSEATAEKSASGSAASESQDSTTDSDKGTDKSTTEEPAAAAATTTASADAASSDVEGLSVKIRVIGPDAEGNDCDWLAEKTVKVKSGTTAADLTQDQFAGMLTADIQASSWGAYLNTITSPFDGNAYGYDATSGKYWQLFVNGAASESGMSQVTLAEGTEIVWYYSAYGASVTGAKVVEDPSLETPDASATRTEGTAEWAGFNQGMAGGAVTADTPASASETALAWNPVKIGMGASDPVLVDGKLYMVSGGTLQVIDSSTGAVLATKKISTKSGYFCRPVYAEGLLIVPLDDGRLMAYTLYSADSADPLKLVWETPRIAANGATQTLSSLTVAGGRVFAAFSVVDWMNPLNGTGYIVSASLKDGSSWQVTSENDEYYWAGAASHGSDIVIADEKGTAYLLSGTDGSEISSVSLGSASHASITKVSDSEYLAVTTDGVLHVLSVSGSKISETGSVKFCDRSTSTAVISNGIAFVGGSTGTSWPYEGTLSAIDLSRIGEQGYVPQTVEVGHGAVQSAPLVVAGSSKTSIYVTTNSIPGGLSLVSYENGTLSAVQTIFTLGDANYQNYCTASPIASASGLIFYTNDSGYLFALKRIPGTSWTISFDTQGGSSVADKTVAGGSAAGTLAAPTRDGYAFAGWYLDEACTKSYDPAYIGKGGSTLTLHAKWVENVPAPGPGDSGDNNDNGSNGTGKSGAGTADSGNGNADSTDATGTNGNAPETRSARTAPATSSAGTVQTAGESGSTDAGTPAETASVTSAPAQPGSTGSQSSSSKGSEDSSEAVADLAGSNTAGIIAWNIVVPVLLLVLGLFLILFALKRRKQEK